jgi:hypothetical protein
MAHLADAIAFVRVSQRSLNDLDMAYDEVCFLRQRLTALDAVYTEIDFVSIALYKQERHRTSLYHVSHTVNAPSACTMAQPTRSLSIHDSVKL